MGNRYTLSQSVRNAMVRVGVSASKIAEVEAGLLAPAGKVKLTRKVIKRIEARLSLDGVAVVTPKRVFSFAGYKSQIKNGHVQGTANVARLGGTAVPAAVPA